jgi:minor extracellular serine protease Vpr
MKQHARFLTSFLLGCVISFSPASGKQLGTCLGSFDIQRNPRIATKANLAAAARKASNLRNKKTIRITALVDASFSSSQLATVGWRLLAQHGDVATFEGWEATAPYLAALDGILSIEYRMTRPYPTMDSTRSQCRINEVHGTVANSLTRHFTGKNVLIGFLDTGFDTHHPNFLDSLGHTRFVALWDQSDTSAQRPNSYGYGLIRMQAEIDKDTAFGLQGSMHGTLTSSMGAGSDKKNPYWGAAPDAMIIAVKYGNASSDIVNGLHWIFSIADSLKMPCVVNMSIGIQEGPHDGTSLIDRTIDAVSGKGHIVVGSAGNDGNKQVHKKFNLSAGVSDGTFFIPNTTVDSTSPSNVKRRVYSAIDIWGEANKSFSDTLYIFDVSTMSYKKSGTVILTNKKSQSEDTLLWPDNVLGPDTIFTYTLVERNAVNLKPHIQFAMNTANTNLACGMRLASTQTQIVHAWNPYKRNLIGLGLAGFSDGDTMYTVDEIGCTAKRIISVGSYFSKTVATTWDGVVIGAGDTTLGMWATWSSVGPTVDGRIKPEICAPGCMMTGALSSQAEDIGHTVVWPDRSNLQGRYEWTLGTSVSSPVVAGIIALMLQANPTLTPETVVSVLQQTATKDKYTGELTTPDVRWGAGKVNALEALKKMGIPIAATYPGNHSSQTKAALCFNSTGNVLSLTRSGSIDSRTVFVDIFDMRGRLFASLPLQNNRTVVVPKSFAKGCFITRARWMGGKTAEQVFTKM